MATRAITPARPLALVARSDGPLIHSLARALRPTTRAHHLRSYQLPARIRLRPTPALSRAIMSSAAAAAGAQRHGQGGAQNNNPLLDETCVPCRKGATMLTQAEIDAHLAALQGGSAGKGWILCSRSSSPTTPSSGPSISALGRTFRFKNFRTALAFTNEVGRIAEEEKHHPEILLEWGSVRVAWWTHAIEGVSSDCRAHVCTVVPRARLSLLETNSTFGPLLTNCLAMHTLASYTRMTSSWPQRRMRSRMPQKGSRRKFLSFG
ncbi:transcriptional coactivator/pterin dehydratase [Tilletiaria anomala UBC 951]|uniref:4a-hydroxytetrahydrobiopterin dehydratase n=1 Tax=Tilletiaria anomala (strain ATCC 24038 / CBS 436.72 / UBC 951) TaxID=1037660 RepID=A0A066WNJ1_TILAU|nr:transcriptional coactivator/pterin dehydratase [Tilletiaria anomala UBC 951]KDN52190.1 transcriptional coactivator/pterin dehydratase [Tilletiaria anomala UBC 951]